ncbi:alpha/beta hydrolase [Alteromonas sp. ASW11-19]|uniref:Alpha/beta hydrolase n=1 Tax=Alteromonas salexigens TaxID=2982530 RepID=A0ABT2VRY4_9ALTE|nr:alpha/beta hydrolase [Alteromonas salexigens]MCU7554669.1 alpha/beta hydrolase [Alteromonas salexigens]
MAQLPVLFLPGTLCDERVWLPVWRQLTLSQRRYIPLQWASTLDDMLMLTGDRVLPDEKVHLVGFSMGGYVAAQWTLANPQQVASLTLIGFNPDGFSAAELNRRQQLVKALKAGQFDPASPNYLNRFVHASLPGDSAVRQTIIDMSNDLGKSTLLAHTQSTTPREALTRQLSQAKFPVHLIAAEADEIAPLADIQQAADGLHPKSFKTLTDTAHMMPLEAPEAVAALLAETVQ